MECIKVLYDYLDTFLNFLYPRNIYCILCNVPIDRYEGYSICLDCKGKLKFIEEKACKKCGKPLDELYIIDKCGQKYLRLQIVFITLLINDLNIFDQFIA